MTGLQNELRILKSGSLVTREEGLAPSRRPFEKGTKLVTCYLLNSNEHAFIYLSLNKMDANNLLRI